jgi:hypothetical protein
MTANEFFKAMGLNAVKQFLENDNIRTKEMHDELKRLVESHELVLVWRMPEGWRKDHNGDNSGLEGAKMYLEMFGNHELIGDDLERFKQAIADVERVESLKEVT